MLVRSPGPPTCDGREALAHETAAQHVARLHLRGDSDCGAGTRHVLTEAAAERACRLSRW